MYTELLTDILNNLICLSFFQGFTLVVSLLILFVIFIYEIKRRD